MRRRSWPTYSGTFESHSSDITGWRARQRLHITSERFDLFDLEHWVILGRPPIGSSYISARPAIPAYIMSVETTVENPDLLVQKMTWSSTLSDF